MSTKVEAKRFTGKAGTWPHYELSLRAHFAVVDLIEHFHGTVPNDADKKSDFCKAQQKIYAYILLTCDDRAATTLLSCASSGDTVGFDAYTTLKNKYGGARDQQLSGLIKEFLTYKQGDDQSNSDYLNDMRAKLSRVEEVAKNDKAKIWDVLTTVSLVEQLKDTEAMSITKKLVFSRMAEAEAAGNPLDFNTVEQIIEHDKESATKEAPSRSTRQTPPNDLALGTFSKKGAGRGTGKGKYKGGRGAGSWNYGGWYQQPPSWNDGGKWWQKKGKNYKGGGKGKGGKDQDHAAALEEKKAALKKIQSEYDILKNKSSGGGGKDACYWMGDDDEINEYPRQSSGASGSGDYTDFDDTDYWSMWDQCEEDKMYSAVETADRATPPTRGREYNKKISRRLEALPNMHARVTELQRHLYVPHGYELKLIPVDSACTVTNMNHESVVPPDRRMSPSTTISVANKTTNSIVPDYEGFGSITVITEFGAAKTLRLGRCIRSPAIQDLLSVSGLTKKGHECILSENNPRMICKDGTVVPFYFCGNLFYMPYLTPIDTHAYIYIQWGK